MNTRPLLPLCALLVFLAAPARANHGPGTSGGGVSTIAGETLKQWKVELTLQTDYTDFEHISRAQAQRIAARSAPPHDEAAEEAGGEEHGGHFDTLNHAWLTTVSLQVGLLDDLTVGAQVGYYWADDFVQAHVHEDGSTGAHTGDIEGLTDLWITAKWRVMKGAPGHLSLLGGVKIPVGTDDQHLSGGEEVHPSSQPGTGAWDFQFGLAYSRFLTAQLSMDASALYTLRTEHDDFKVGDRFDAGVALNYRLTENIRRFPQVGVFTELLVVWIGRDREGGDDDRNSGGTTWYVQPGLRVRFTENVSLTAAVGVPVVQDLYGDQADVRARASIGLTLSF